VDPARAELQSLIREHHGWVLARLVRQVRDLELAEDVLSRAIEAALLQWPTSGVPEAPRAWLIRTARNKAIDELRRREAWTRKRDEVAVLEGLDVVDDPDDTPLRDDMLRLIFTCCHPALAEEARVALTLQVVGGLQADEIARAFLVPTATMAQRLVRAKRKIKDAGVPYRVPGPDEIAERVDGVRAVVYLVFNEGYSATAGDALVRHDLCRHAIRIGESLLELFDGDSECAGLLALMLLHESRHRTREDEAGDIVLLADQDRSQWDRAQIGRGTSLVTAALRRGSPGPYALQAAIAAVHANAPVADQTDWPQIAGLYDRLFALVPTAVVALNRAVAIAFAEGPSRGLAEIDALADELGEYFLFHSARADLLRRCARGDEALVAYRRALELCRNQAEIRFLRGRIAQVESRS
jgi:RNA polymerase sigma-70 factor (ECF subfamily)